MCSMKIKIVGNGELAHDYLTVGKVYDVDEYDDSGIYRACFICNFGHYILLDKECAYLEGATGDLHWEIVEE